jgi:hypothetical protein
MEQGKKDFNALNKEIATLKKVCSRVGPLRAYPRAQLHFCCLPCAVSIRRHAAA